jgi:hypothetical protein
MLFSLKWIVENQDVPKHTWQMLCQKKRKQSLRKAKKSAEN